MKQHALRRLSGGLAVGGAVMVIPAAAAWACLSLAGISTNNATVQPGQSVVVNGVEFGSNPVQIHYNGLNGPVLATATPDSNSGNFTQAVTIPATASPGQAVLVATEAAATPDGKNNGSSTGAPARALINVTGAGGAPLAATSANAARATGVTTSAPTGVGTLALVGLGAAGVSLLAGGMFALVGSRRRSPVAETVKDS